MTLSVASGQNGRGIGSSLPHRESGPHPRVGAGGQAAEDKLQGLRRALGTIRDLAEAPRNPVRDAAKAAAKAAASRRLEAAKERLKMLHKLKVLIATNPKLMARQTAAIAREVAAAAKQFAEACDEGGTRGGPAVAGANADPSGKTPGGAAEAEAPSAGGETAEAQKAAAEAQKAVTDAKDADRSDPPAAGQGPMAVPVSGAGQDDATADATRDRKSVENGWLAERKERAQEARNNREFMEKARQAFEEAMAFFKAAAQRLKKGDERSKNEEIAEEATKEFGKALDIMDKVEADLLSTPAPSAPVDLRA